MKPGFASREPAVKSWNGDARHWSPQTQFRPIATGGLPIAIGILVLGSISSCGVESFCSSGSYECASLNRSGASGTSASAGTAGTTTSGGTGGETGTAGSGNTANAGGSATTGGASGTAGSGGQSATGGTTNEAGNGGEGGMSGAGTGGAPCDPTKTPEQDSCVINEAYGVFVSPQGDDDTGDGSRATPYATIAKAIDKAKTDTKRVYACADAGDYNESIDLDASTSGLKMYGGFSCANWHYSTSAQSRIASDTSLALHVEGLTGLTIEDFQIDAADASKPGGSSIGAFVVSSTGVMFSRVQIDAGKGSNGANGTVTEFMYPDRTDLDGNSTSSAMGADPKVCMCPTSQQTSGGGGGYAQPGGQGGGNGTPTYSGPGGEAGTPGSCTSGGAPGAGKDGATAPAISPAAGAQSLGALTSSGWTPTAGTDGPDGAPGQGGGGGASSTSGGGGGGACGGCGGAGGKGGQGGGGSIALAVFKSTVTLDNVDLHASDAGKGGNGIAGQAAQTASGFAGNGTMGGCQGGAGGLGADGAASGGGAGGSSVAILWSGDTAPVQSGVMVVLGTAGAKGTGGKAGVNDGIAGKAQNIINAM